MLDGDHASLDQLRTAVTELLTDPSRRIAMAREAATHGKPDAADHVLTEILTAAAGRHNHA